MLSILLSLIFGGLAGWVFSFIVRPEKPNDVLVDIVIGMGASVLGGIFYTRGRILNNLDPNDMIVSIFSAFLLLIIVSFVRQK